MAFDPVSLGLSALGTIGGLFGGGGRSSGMQSWGNINPQEFFDNYRSNMNPVYQQLTEGLDSQREDSEKRAAQFSNQFANDETRNEFRQALEKDGFNSYLDAARSGYIGWGEAGDRLALSAQRSGMTPADKVWGGNSLGSVLNYFDQQELKDKPTAFSRGVTSIAQQFLGRPLTKEELARYTPNNGFTSLTQVANDLGTTLEAEQRNPAPYLQALGTRSGYGVTIRKGQNQNPYFKNNTDNKKQNKNQNSVT